jgi:hypothetical protein
MTSKNPSAGVWFGAAALAATGFAALARAVARGEMTSWDRRVKRALHRAQAASMRPALVLASRSTTPLGNGCGTTSSTTGSSNTGRSIWSSVFGGQPERTEHVFYIGVRRCTTSRSHVIVGAP